MKRHQLSILFILIVFPATLLFNIINLPVPMFYRAVEFAGYYQTQAFLNHGLGSFQYLSFAESSAGLHIHALFSILFTWIDITIAGRIASLVSAVIGAALLAWIATTLIDWRVGALAVAGMWLHPLYRRLGSTWMPEMLGIVLTLAVLATAIKWQKEGDKMWYVISIILLILSIQNHAWEASIVLPVIGIAVYEQKYRAALGYVGAVASGITLLFFVKSLQPSTGSLLESYAIIYNPLFILTEEWIFWREFGVQGLYAATMTMTIPVICLAMLVAGMRWVQYQNQTTAIIGLWLLSGFAPLLLLPGGYPAHSYYAWGTVTPLSLAIAWATFESVDNVQFAEVLPEFRTIVTIGIALVILTVTIPSVQTQQQAMQEEAVYPTANGHVSTEGQPLVRAGQELASRSPTGTSQVAFVGPWGGSTETMYQNYELPGMMRVLVYSELFAKQRSILGGPESPQLVMTISDVNRTRCEQMVVLEPSNRTAQVSSC